MKPRAVALRISVAAMFVALTLIVAYLPTIPGSALKFSGFPLLLGGLLIGPRTGFAIGCLTDLVNFALHPAGMFFPGFTLTQGLTAMLPGLMTRRRDPMTGKPLWGDGGYALPLMSVHPALSYLRLLAIFAVTKILTSVLLVSIFTSKIVVGTPLVLELAHRAMIQAFHVPVYAFLALMVLRGLAQSELYGRILRARR